MLYFARFALRLGCGASHHERAGRYFYKLEADIFGIYRANIGFEELNVLHLFCGDRVLRAICTLYDHLPILCTNICSCY